MCSPHHNAVISLVAELLIKDRVVPSIHSSKSTLLLEERIDVVQGKVIVLDGHVVSAARRIHDCFDSGTTLFKCINIVNSVWEPCQNKLVGSWLTAVDDLFQHLNLHTGWNELIALSHFGHFNANGSFPIALIFDQGHDIEIHEAMLFRKLLSHFALQVGVGAVPDVDHRGLNVVVN